jgi:exopolysaccharide biosynthesis polyprenyl glycosylphosphotransferase
MEIEPTTQKGRIRLRDKERQLILILGDFFVTIFSLLLALYFWAQKDWLTFSWAFLDQRAPTWFYLIPVLWILFLIEIYDNRRANRHSEVLRTIGRAAAISIVLYLIVFFISQPNSLPRRGVAVFIVSATLLTTIWRFAYILIFTAPVFNRRVLVIGAGVAGTTLVSMVGKIEPQPFDIIGYIDDDPEKLGQEFFGHKVVGKGSDLLQCIKSFGVTDLIFAISGELKPDLFRAILTAEEEGHEVTSLPTVYEELFGRVPILLLESDWVLRTFIDLAHTTGLYESFKRLLDIIGGIIGLLFLIALYPLFAILIILDSGNPVLYSQLRVGKNGRAYKIYKFRTMKKDPIANGIGRMTTEGDLRITRIGKILRRSHLDELPQVINILRGENSIVGPRAEQLELVDQFQQKIPFYRARLLVKPGLTGWAQINQRYASTVEDTVVKLEFDLYYIKHRTLLLDFNIIVRTVWAVLGFRGL